jgi:hypothetical protein
MTLRPSIDSNLVDNPLAGGSCTGIAFRYGLGKAVKSITYALVRVDKIAVVPRIVKGSAQPPAESVPSTFGFLLLPP